MIAAQSNFLLNSEILKDGEYYVFSKQQGGQNCLGYVYTTWCGSPCGIRMSFSPVEVGKPLSLVSSGDSDVDQGQLQNFRFSSKDIQLVNDVYNRAMFWLNQVQRGLTYPQLDESAGCTPVIILINEGVLCASYTKEEFLEAYSLLDVLFGNAIE